MNNQHFQFEFSTSLNPDEVFAFLIDPKNWWTGLFGEKIEGKSSEINDEFSFKAGDSVHFSNQKLIEMELHKKIVWLVTDSKLSFLKNTNEWTGTKICFEIEQEANKTKVTFSHVGLLPEIECYGSCTNAWTQYLQNLKTRLN